MQALPQDIVAGAGFTSTNPNNDGIDKCKNGPAGLTTPSVNCNLYTGKEFVWLNGGPNHSGPSALSEGIYFFAILEPSGQAHSPNDGGDHNLSDTDPKGGRATAGCGTGTGCGDTYSNRRFRVGSNGDVAQYMPDADAGTPDHLQDAFFNSTHGLLLRPYYFDDTDNNGGVYIMALCRLGPVGGPLKSGGVGGNVVPSDCKYDAFKVAQGTGDQDETLDAIISIEADATNEVNDAHTFTVSAKALGGKPNYSFRFYNMTVKDAGNNNVAPTSNTCPTVATSFQADPEYTCEITVNSATPGVLTVNASVEIKDQSTNPGQQTATATTNGVLPNSGPGVKTYVDARISVSANGTNSIGEAHNVTGFVEINPGTGWVNAPNGVVISYTIASGPGSLSAASCTTTGGTGKCTVQLNSSVSGTTKVDASTSVVVGGVTMTRATDVTAGTGGLTKVWEDGSLTWYKNRSTTGARLAGATFSVCRTANWNSTTSAFDAPLATPVCISVADNTGQVGYTGRDTDADGGEFKVEGLQLGKYTVTETAAPANWVLDPTPKSTPAGYLSLTNQDYTFSVAFVNTPAYANETATGGGYPWSLTKGAPLTWFMYTPWAATDVTPPAGIFNWKANGWPTTIGLAPNATAPLIAGQNMLAGTVNGQLDGSGKRQIVITLQNNFRFALGLANSVKVLPMASCLPASSINFVQPGQFTVKQTPGAGVTTVTVIGPANGGAATAWANAACYGIHVDVQRPLVW